MAALPLPDRVRLRAVCHTFASAVDTALAIQRSVSDSEDLFELDQGGRSGGDAMRWLAAKCPNLQVLEVKGCGKGGRIQHSWKLAVADAIVNYPHGHQCHQLRTLGLHGCKGLGDVDVKAVAANCGDLPLGISGCRHVDDNGVIVVVQNCSSLEVVDYASSGVGDRAIATLVRECARLKRLRLDEATSDRAVDLGLDSCRELRSLTIMSPSLTHAAIARVAPACRELRVVFLQLPRRDRRKPSHVCGERCPRLEGLCSARGVQL
eukprot:jgi/Mesvir1/14342/Mv09750-RA.1